MTAASETPAASTRLDGLRLCLSLLTVYPVRGPAVLDRRQGRNAMLLAPLAGVALWLPCALTVLVLRAWINYDFGSLPPAVLGIALLALLTRGLHLDGLADIADALGSYRDPAGAREIMRRGDVGPLGVITVLFVILLQVSLLDITISNHHGTVGLFVAVISGRLAMLVSCSSGTPVAPGSTLGALVVGTVSRTWVAIAVAAGVVLCGLAAQMDYHTLDRRAETLQAVLAPVFALAVIWPLRRHIVRRLEGVAGDALGALCEIATLAAIAVMAGSPGGIATGGSFFGQ